MFKEMRRKRQALMPDEIDEVLNRGRSGVMALCADDDYPYSIPISYVYDGSKLYFHCAKTGRKLDIIRRNNKASFCVIDQDKVIPEEYTTYYKSAIVFGRISVIEDEKEKLKTIEKLAVKYAPNDNSDGRNRAIDRDWEFLCMLQLDIEHKTWKKAKELLDNKNNEK